MTTIDWQPIATAPKDGRLILIYPGAMIDRIDDDNVYEDRAGVARWDGYDMSGRWDYGHDLGIEPEDVTHWAPLPDPPADAVDSGRYADKP